MNRYLRVFYLSSLIVSMALTQAQAADYYVRSSASGSNNGTSWANAWTNVTSISWTSIQPGDTIWIAGGSYGQLTPKKSGNADTAAGRIFIKRATAAAHGSDTGWTSGYDAQVVLSGINWSTLNLGAYVTVDGQVPDGIKVPHGQGDGAVSITFDRGVNYVTLRYLEIAGPCDSTDCHHSGDDRGIDTTAWNGSSYELIDRLLVQNNNIHGACTNIWLLHTDNSIWELNDIHDSHDTNGVPCHPNIVASQQTNNVTFRFNKIHHYDAEGIMMLGSEGTWYIYGNLWYDGLTYARVLESQNSQNGPVYFYNNTVVGLWGGITDKIQGGTWASGSRQANNIWWNTSYDMGLPTTGNEFCSGSCGGTGSISSGSNPFVNLTGNDFRLLTTVGAKYPRDKGTNLGTPFNRDLLGVTRGADGAWDMGAFEFDAGGTTAPPASVQGLAVSVR